MRLTILATAIVALLIAPALAGTGAGNSSGTTSEGTGIGKGSGSGTTAAGTGVGKGSGTTAAGTGIGKGTPPAMMPPPPPPPPPVSGIQIVHHRVADYAAWRPIFDGDKASQEAAGLTHPHVYAGRNANDVYIVFDMADMAKAKAFAESRELRRTMRKAGVRGAPDIMYLTPEK